MRKKYNFTGPKFGQKRKKPAFKRPVFRIKGERKRKSGGFVQNPMNLFGLELGQSGFLELTDPFLGKPDHRGDFLEVQVRIHSESEVKS